MDVFTAFVFIGLGAFAYYYPKLGVSMIFILYTLNFTFNYIYVDGKNANVMDVIFKMDVSDVRRIYVHASDENAVCVQFDELFTKLGTKCFNHDDGYIPQQLRTFIRDHNGKHF